MEGGEVRPARPSLPLGQERSGGDLSGGAAMSPLVMNLVRLMGQERERAYNRSRGFYPSWWMYNKIRDITMDYSPEWRGYVKSEKGRKSLQAGRIDPDSINTWDNISDEGLNERQDFFDEINWAYGIAAYPQFTPMQKNSFRDNLQRWKKNINIDSVTLTEQQRQVLSQIATATETPIDPDQQEYRFSTVLQQPDITDEEMIKDPRF